LAPVMPAIPKTSSIIPKLNWSRKTEFDPLDFAIFDSLVFFKTSLGFVHR
jgi:hypothetical protein